MGERHKRRAACLSRWRRQRASTGLAYLRATASASIDQPFRLEHFAPMDLPPPGTGLAAPGFNKLLEPVEIRADPAGDDA